MFDIQELTDRLERAKDSLLLMCERDYTRANRLRSKAEGVSLALSYISDMKRSESGSDSNERSE